MQDVVLEQNIAFCANFAEFCFLRKTCSAPCANDAQNVARILRKKYCPSAKTLFQRRQAAKKDKKSSITSAPESRNILPNEAQSEVDMHGRSSCTNACERWISLQSMVSGRRMPYLYQSEVRESVESYRCSEDINSGLEDSP